LQNLLFAGQKYSLLIILQGMDASGKDGTIRHVFSAMNPMGVNIKAFKSPSEEEKSHDFLWRIHQHTPQKGMIEIFNRSQYEDILVPKVHRTIGKKTIAARFDLVNDFEKMLLAENTLLLKFFLHISPEEQKQRIKERLTVKHKKWKYDPSDTIEAKYWKEYRKVYEEVFQKCSKHAEWTIVPADNKWYRDYVIAKKVHSTLKALNMKYPSGNSK
jgi:PPK2 family polyphosphate:nucleotide phosphotransferase